MALILRWANAACTCASALASTLFGLNLTVMLRSLYSMPATASRLGSTASASPSTALILVNSSGVPPPLLARATAILRRICAAGSPVTGWFG